MRDAARAVGQAFRRHRRRFAVVVLGAGGAIVASIASRDLPLDTAIAFDLGADHGEFVEARIRYLCEDDDVHAVDFRHQQGAPREILHRVELAPCRYRIRAALTGPRGSRFLERTLVVPADGTVHIRLDGEASFAGRQP